MPFLLSNDAPWFSKELADGSYFVELGNGGGGGDAGLQITGRGSRAGVRRDGYEVRLEAVVVAGGLIDDTVEGLDGKSCESLFDPDALLRFSGGRVFSDALPCPVAGGPTRSPKGTALNEGCRSTVGEPI